MTAQLPALFVPHGAPTFALAPGAAGAALAAFPARLQKPRALLVVSAHWPTPGPRVGAAMAPETVHDFQGFPDALYDIAYPAPGSPDLARQAADLLQRAGHAATLDEARGLDHAVWIPLRLMYPAADVAVVPLAIQPGQGPEHHYHLGQALAPLLEDGVLLIASGNLTHNLRHWQLATATPAYVGQFSGWIVDRLATGDIDSLLDYRRQAPGALAAHPGDDHLLPLFVALGAAGRGYRCEVLYRGVTERILAMDAYALWPG